MLVLATAFAPARAQRAVEMGRFVLRGEVRDSNDAPIARATVEVYGTGRSTATNDSGRFVLTGLPEGMRAAEVLAIGYKSRLVAVTMSDSTPFTTFVLAKQVLILDSMRVLATTSEVKLSRRRDVIGTKEFEAPDVAGSSALDAFALLRPQLFFNGRPPGGQSSTTEAAQRGQLYPRDTIAGHTFCAGWACNVDKRLSVSVNSGPLSSPDILSVLPARIIKEMRYLLPVDAQARFGLAAGGGPVLLVVTK